MQLHRLTPVLALTLGAIGFSSRASAQEPQEPLPPTHEPLYDIPDRAPPQAMPAAAPTTPSTTTTTSAEYNEQATAEREQPYRPNRLLLTTGATLFVVPYLAGVIVAAQSDLEADKRNYIPVVGPWLDLGQRPCAFGSACSTGDNVGSAFLIGSGVAQGAGIILATTSLFLPEKTERTEVRTAVHVVPVSFAHGGGVGAVGFF